MCLQPDKPADRSPVHPARRARPNPERRAPSRHTRAPAETTPRRGSALFPHEFTGRDHLRIVAVLALALSLAGLLNGCISKSKAEAQARAAYLAGRRDATAQWQQESRGPGVLFVGPVNQPFVKWSEGLTLGHAIVDAGYSAPVDPRNVVVRRNGQGIQVDPKRLLQGDDFPLEPGDIVELQP